jgi:hypothetical protein
MAGLVEEFLRFVRKVEEITRPPQRRPFADLDEPLGMCGVCDLPVGHDGEHWVGDEQLAGSPEKCADMEAEMDRLKAGFRVEPPLTDDELVAVRGLIQERYKDSVAADFPAGVESPTPPVGIPLATDMANRAIRYTYADFARKPPQ